MIRIGFIAVAQAHQHLHWLPAALELARRPGVQVDVLCPSRAGLRFIRSYDPERRLRLRWLPWPWKDGLFDLPPRRAILIAYQWLFRRYPTLVTSESTSVLLKKRRFRSKLIRIRHGAGDRDSVFDPRIIKFDLTLVAGEKDKQRLIEARHATDETCIVSGYAKFELVRPPERLFPVDRPIVLYNPHSAPHLSSWFRMGNRLIAEMVRLKDWNFIVAPHVKADGGTESGKPAGNVIIDRGSVRAIDMTYVQAADIYIGDVSSQVYEFLQTPRPCIFINAHKVDWRGNEAYANWKLGQVIESAEELGPALERAAELQPEFEPLQRAAMQWTIDESAVPASVRQADAILDFIRSQAD